MKKEYSNDVPPGVDPSKLPGHRPDRPKAPATQDNDDMPRTGQYFKGLMAKLRKPKGMRDV